MNIFMVIENTIENTNSLPAANPQNGFGEGNRYGFDISRY